MKKLNIALDFRDPQWIENVVVGAENTYRDVSNCEKINKCEHVVKHVTADTYKFALMDVIRGRIVPEDLQTYIVNSRSALHLFLTQRYAGVDISNINALSFEYIGTANIEDLTPGSIYTVIEFSNWFHNPDEIGFYIRNDDYAGNDPDYGHFFSLYDFNKYFKVVVS